MIDIQNMSFWYKEKAKVFDSLSMSMEAGNIYGLLGENGVTLL
jgi:ABC-type multidrug transport system ATPase subunit